jgi:hypothetical protein
MGYARNLFKKTSAPILAFLAFGLTANQAMAANYIQLTIINGGSVPLTIERMKEDYCSWNEFNVPVGQIWPNIQPGKFVVIRVTRVDGHGCDGKNGKIQFLFTPPGKGPFSSQLFEFTSGYGLWTGRQANPYPGKLMKTGTGQYSYTTPASKILRVVGKPVGKWEHLCPPGGLRCKVSIKESVSKERSEGTTISRSETSSLTRSISAGIEFKGISVGASAETSKSRTQESAISTANSVATGQERTDEIDIPYKRGKLGVVWRWIITSRMSDGQVIVIKTLSRACTAYDQAPNFLPNSKQAIDSCQI